MHGLAPLHRFCKGEKKEGFFFFFFFWLKITTTTTKTTTTIPQPDRTFRIRQQSHTRIMARRYGRRKGGGKLEESEKWERIKTQTRRIAIFGKFGGSQSGWAVNQMERKEELLE